MPSNPDQQAFNVALTKLFEAEQISIPLLFRLSDMAPHETTEFAGRWPDASDERRAAIAQHLADISEENFEVDFSAALAVCLDDRLAAVRRAALDGLWDTSNVSLIQPILRLTVEDADLDVRVAAARTLAHFVLMGAWGQIARPVSERLVQTLGEHYRNPALASPVRQAILEALGPSDHPHVSAWIEEAYASGDEDWQLSALYAMGSSADPRWLEIILADMEHPYAEFRAIAARSAGEIGQAEAIDPLLKLVYDQDGEVQAAAVRALGQIGGDRVSRILTRLGEDEDLENLYDVIDETLEEMDWSGGHFNLLDFEFDDDYPDRD